ncbi:glycerol-3-phosphate 1-O-acyltransferase PlsY [Bacillus sp. FJAT-47783]|uniref:glycerol-3-phosphate 1-O-acyltransferase PlsY n=1 Tax=Bacillus sp. FJAT-47783 TaxID=2922712 RepID=UPI001FAD1C1B|nr:glycerol-3-phosphate 1-O-acyltransferase PlsY [Bacillus sp. FJAT-47783]
MIVVLVITSYFIGSIMFGYLTATRFGHIDIQNEGSGNVGARNVGRLIGKKAFVYTFLGDAAKGSIVVLWAQYLDVSDFWQLVTLLSAILGHLFPVFLNFRGGKGVSTFIGGFLVYSPIMFLVFTGFFLVVFFLIRSMTIAGLLAICIAPFLLLMFQVERGAVMVMCVITIIILLAHRNNIAEKLKTRGDG